MNDHIDFCYYCLKAYLLRSSIADVRKARVTLDAGWGNCYGCGKMYCLFHCLETNSDRPNVVTCWPRDLGHNLEFYKRAPMVFQVPTTKVCFLIGDRVSEPVTSE